MRTLCALLIGVAAMLPAIAFAAPAVNTDGSESLGNKLLDDLTPPTNNAGGLTPKNDAAPQKLPVTDLGNTPNAPAQPAASAMVPLARVQQGMLNARTLLAQPATSSEAGTIKQAGTVQKDVVSQLDKLIAELSKQCQCQCQGGQCDKPGDSASNKPPGNKQGNKPGSSAASGKASARESSDRLDSTTAKPVEKGDDVNEMVKELWGHLPERSREQMLQSFSDEFLPKYQVEIEQYYRRLGEEQDAATRNNASQK